MISISSCRATMASLMVLLTIRKRHQEEEPAEYPFQPVDTHHQEPYLLQPGLRVLYVLDPIQGCQTARQAQHGFARTVGGAQLHGPGRPGGRSDSSRRESPTAIPGSSRTRSRRPPWRRRLATFTSGHAATRVRMAAAAAASTAVLEIDEHLDLFAPTLHQPADVLLDDQEPAEHGQRHGHDPGGQKVGPEKASRRLLTTRPAHEQDVGGLHGAEAAQTVP